MGSPVCVLYAPLILLILVFSPLQKRRSISKAAGGNAVPADGLDTNLAWVATTACTGLAASHAALLYASIKLLGERLWLANGSLGEILPLVSLFAIQVWPFPLSWEAGRVLRQLSLSAFESSNRAGVVPCFLCDAAGWHPSID